MLIFARNLKETKNLFKHPVYNGFQWRSFPMRKNYDFYAKICKVLDYLYEFLVNNFTHKYPVLYLQRSEPRFTNFRKGYIDVLQKYVRIVNLGRITLKYNSNSFALGVQFYFLPKFWESGGTG